MVAFEKLTSKSCSPHTFHNFDFKNNAPPQKQQLDVFKMLKFMNFFIIVKVRVFDRWFFVCVFVVLQLPSMATQAFAVIDVCCLHARGPVKLVSQFIRLYTERGRE